MKKQVILTTEEYEILTKLAALAIKVNDSYIQKAHKNKKLLGHIMDTEGADPVQKEIFTTIVYMNGDLIADIEKNLGDDYEVSLSSSAFRWGEGF